DGRITFVNPQVEALLGYRPEELVGRSIGVVATPETRATAADRVRRLQAGEALAATTVGELVHRNGRMVAVEVNNALLRRDGQVVGVLGIIRDITARRAMERELERQQRELEALNEVGRAIGASLELDRVLDLILEKARELLSVTYCAVLRLDEAAGELYHLRALGLGAGEEDVRFRLGEGLAGLAALERTPVMSVDVLADKRARPTSPVVRYGLRSALAIPLAVPDRVFGVLIIFRPEPGGFADPEVRLASAFADQAAIALVNASLYEQSQRDLAQLTALREAVEAVSSELHRGLLLQKLIMSAVRLLGGDAGSVGLYEPEEGAPAGGSPGRIRLAALHNLPAELLGRVFRPGVGVVGRILETGEPLVMQAYGDAPDRITFPGAENLHGVLSVPIRYQGQLMGTFTIGSRDPARRFTERDVETLSVFAKHAGIAIENARLYRECQAYAKGLEERVLERTRDLAAQKAFTDGVVEALPLGLYVVDRDLRVVTCNRAGEGELGVGQGRLRGMSLLDLLPETKRAAARAALEEIFARGAVGRSEEEFTEAGQTRTLRMTRAPLRTEGDAVTYAILLIEDITERKRLERQVLTAEKLAAVGGLAAGVAHELNNPLATIAGCAEGLLDRLRGPDLRAVEGIADFAEYLRIIEEETYRCKEITGALLQFVREPGRAREPADLNAALEKALTLVSHQPRFRTLTLRSELAPGLPPARVNEGQIRQVFLSLLLNALEATPGEGILTVRSLALAEPDGPKVAVEFEDQGAGIAPEHLPRIFEPFFTTKPAGKGTGLGLAICQGIVTEHGGRIDVRSQVG
ncbi:MAG TPA: GAF domain-containing protein, partial [Candidatus Methylomirabilis sp.]